MQLRERKDYMRNNTYIQFEIVSKKYIGYIGTKKLLENGFSNRQISILEKEGYLEKVCHGYYWLTGGKYKKPFDYKCIEVSLSDPRGVICMESALFYQGILKQEPEKLSVATERIDRSLLKMNYPIDRHYFSGNNFQIGLKKKKTKFGKYNIYDIERSICDIQRLNKSIDMELINEVGKEVQRYKRMLKYAEQLNVKIG